MKKIIALALALVMVLGLSVSAFAAVKLVKVEDEETETTEIESIGFIAKDENDNKETFVAPKAGTYYVEVEDAKDAKDLKVEATGNVTAKLANVDPTDDAVAYTGLDLHNYYVKALANVSVIESYKYANQNDFEFVKTGYDHAKREDTGYYKAIVTVYTKDAKDNYTEYTGEIVKKAYENKFYADKECTVRLYVADEVTSVAKGDKLVWWDFEDRIEEDIVIKGRHHHTFTIEKNKDVVNLMEEAVPYEAEIRGKTYTFGNTYEDATALKKALNEKFDTTKFQVFDDGDLPTVIEVTVGENYSASYKTGSVILTGKIKDATTGKYVDAKYAFDVISDVVIFARQDVLDFADKTALDSTMDGYSDFYSYKRGYNDPDQQLYWTNPVVVPTTSFSAVVGKDVSYTGSKTLETAMYTSEGALTATFDLTATIKDVVAGQKGVNFTMAAKAIIENDIDKDKVLDDAEALKSIELGFKGNQTIASDFEIEVESNLTWFELRELFQEKLEENDVLKFYLLKDGKAYNELVVDYGKQTLTADGETVDIDVTEDEVEFTILGKAGDTLGYYTLTLDAPAAEEPEENPNTGAETMVGAVIALAVVSVASAAAVSLKK